MKFNKPMMETAYVWAKMSSCKRKQVGAVLEKDGRILSIGYNGTISGSKSNDCEIECPECKGNGKTSSYKERECETCQGKGMITNKFVIHAEKNLISFCAKNGINTNGCTVHVTLMPCIECSQIMVQAGVKAVKYAEDYKDTSGIEFLKEAGVIVQKYKN